MNVDRALFIWSCVMAPVAALLGQWLVAAIYFAGAGVYILTGRDAE